MAVDLSPVRDRQLQNQIMRLQVIDFYKFLPGLSSFCPITIHFRIDASIARAEANVLIAGEFLLQARRIGMGNWLAGNVLWGGRDPDMIVAR